MPLTEAHALDILSELIRKTESRAEDIPRIWNEIITTYNAAFAPAPEPVKKKRRRRANNPLSPNLGWPQGVSRAEYKAWKESQQAKGVTDGLNPQEYKRFKEAGNFGQKALAPKAKAEPKAEAKPAAKPEAKAVAKPAAKAAAEPKGKKAK